VSALELARGLIRAASPNPPGDERAVAAAVADAAAGLGLPRPRVVARDERRPTSTATASTGSARPI
jgi:hypothetical protein